MKALSIRQPWAWLIANGWKDVENRTWATEVRGQILLHAGKTFDREGYEWVRSLRPQIPMPPAAGFERGGIVGVARIVGCVTDSNSWWFSGPYGFRFADAEPLPFGPLRGQLGFFDVSADEYSVGEREQ